MKEERTNGCNVRMRIRKYAFLMAAAIVIALLIVAQVKLFPMHLNAEESVIFILLAGYGDRRKFCVIDTARRYEKVRRGQEWKKTF